MKIKIGTLLSAFTILPLSLWAADISGTWKSEFESQIGRQQYTFTFTQDGTRLTGKADSVAGDRKREEELKEGKVEGDAVSFVEVLKIQDNEIRVTYTGKLSAAGDEIKFERAVGDFGKADIIAKREHAASTGTAMAAKAIRIKAGRSTPFTDSSGNVWSAEQGFEGGDSVERDPAPKIAGTKDPELFLTEHYSMDSFSTKLSNGKYVAKLYFSETYEGITGPGERVFSFNVQGREFKDFDIFAKAGGANRAYIETVPIEVTNGTFKITFTSNVENPAIDAIEIIPESASASTQVPAVFATTAVKPSTD